jgi:hypothetical protein
MPDTKAGAEETASRPGPASRRLPGAIAEIVAIRAAATP